MAKAKRTPWFPGDVKPVHIGVYERQVGPRGKFSHWNGEFWCGWGGTINIAVWNGQKRYRSSVQEARWRGLTRGISPGSPK